MTSWVFYIYRENFFNLSKTKKCHWVKAKWLFWAHITGLLSVFLAGPFWEAFQMKTVFFAGRGAGGGIGREEGLVLEPAEPGPGENKANWSRKCHYLTLSQADVDQKESECNTKCKESALKGAQRPSVTFAIKRETSRCATFFRNAERSSTLHMLLVDVGPGRTLAFCHVILSYGNDSLQMALNHPWMMISHT